MPRLRRFGRFLLKLLGVLLAVYAFDVVLTRYLLPDALLARIDLERLSRIHSPIYHHGLRPMRVVEVARWGTHNYRFATNSLGFKDGAAREVPLTSDKHRIVIIGDSFTEGSGYGFDDTFAGRIAHALEPKGIEVFNAGVISYSPAIYYRRLKYLIETEGFGFDEVVVFLDISDIQDEVRGVFLDEDDNVIGRGGGAADRWLDSVIEPIRSFMKDSSLLYRFISEANRARKRLWTHANPCLERLGTRADDPRPLGLEFLRQQLVKPRNSWTFDEAVYQEWGREGLKIASANMDRLLAVLAQHHIALTLAVYPWPAQVFEGDLESRQVRFWQDWAAARGVPFLDLFPAFIGETSPLEAYARYFIPCDSHFNAAGHALVAEGYLAFHEAQGPGSSPRLAD